MKKFIDIVRDLSEGSEKSEKAHPLNEKVVFSGKTTGFSGFSIDREYDVLVDVIGKGFEKYGFSDVKIKIVHEDMKEDTESGKPRTVFNYDVVFELPLNKVLKGKLSKCTLIAEGKYNTYDVDDYGYYDFKLSHYHMNFGNVSFGEEDIEDLKRLHNLLNKAVDFNKDNKTFGTLWKH